MGSLYYMIIVPWAPKPDSNFKGPYINAFCSSDQRDARIFVCSFANDISVIRPGTQDSGSPARRLSMDRPKYVVSELLAPQLRPIPGVPSRFGELRLQSALGAFLCGLEYDSRTESMLSNHAIPCALADEYTRQLSPCMALSTSSHDF